MNQIRMNDESNEDSDKFTCACFANKMNLEKNF